MHTCYLHWYNYVDPRFQCFLHTINKQKKIPLLRDTRSDFCLWTQGNLYNTKRNWGTQEISMDLCRDANSFEKPRSFNERKKNRNHVNYCIFNLVISLACKVLFVLLIHVAVSSFILWPRRMLRHSKCIKTRSHFLKHCYCISSDKIYNAAHLQLFV